MARMKTRSGKRRLALPNPHRELISKAVKHRFPEEELPGRDKEWVWNWIGILAPHEAFMYVLIDDELCWMSYTVRDYKRFDAPYEIDGELPAVDLDIGGGMTIGEGEHETYVPFTAAWRPDNGETDASIDLTLQPTMEKRVYRAFAENGKPMPDIKIAWKPLPEFIGEAPEGFYHV